MDAVLVIIIAAVVLLVILFVGRRLMSGARRRASFGLRLRAVRSAPDVRRLSPSASEKRRNPAPHEPSGLTRTQRVVAPSAVFAATATRSPRKTRTPRKALADSTSESSLLQRPDGSESGGPDGSGISLRT